MEKMINKIETDHMTPAELRSFGLITGAIAAVLFGLLIPWLPIFGHHYPKWPWILAGVLAAMALIYPFSLKPVYKVWMTFGGVLGFINTRIILGILFFLVFLPFGIALKLFGKDPMSRKLDDNAASYRVESERRDPSHLEKPY